MGVDAETYRIRIGCFGGKLQCASSSHVKEGQSKIDQFLMCHGGKVVVLGLLLALLIIGGVEQNPGPGSAYFQLMICGFKFALALKQEQRQHLSKSISACKILKNIDSKERRLDAIEKFLLVDNAKRSGRPAMAYEFFYNYSAEADSGGVNDTNNPRAALFESEDAPTSVFSTSSHYDDISNSSHTAGKIKKSFQRPNDESLCEAYDADSPDQNSSPKNKSDNSNGQASSYCNGSSGGQGGSEDSGFSSTGGGSSGDGDDGEDKKRPPRKPDLGDDDVFENEENEPEKDTLQDEEQSELCENQPVENHASPQQPIFFCSGRQAEGMCSVMIHVDPSDSLYRFLYWFHTQHMPALTASDTLQPTTAPTCYFSMSQNLEAVQITLDLVALQFIINNVSVAQTLESSVVNIGMIATNEETERNELCLLTRQEVETSGNPLPRVPDLNQFLRYLRRFLTVSENRHRLVQILVEIDSSASGSVTTSEETEDRSTARRHLRDPEQRARVSVSTRSVMAEEHQRAIDTFEGRPFDLAQGPVHAQMHQLPIREKRSPASKKRHGNRWSRRQCPYSICCRHRMRGTFGHSKHATTDTVRWWERQRRTAVSGGLMHPSSDVGSCWKFLGVFPPPLARTQFSVPPPDDDDALEGSSSRYRSDNDTPTLQGLPIQCQDPDQIFPVDGEHDRDSGETRSLQNLQSLLIKLRDNTCLVTKCEDESEEEISSASEGEHTDEAEDVSMRPFIQIATRDGYSLDDVAGEGIQFGSPTSDSEEEDISLDRILEFFHVASEDYSDSASDVEHGENQDEDRRYASDWEAYSPEETESPQSTSDEDEEEENAGAVQSLLQEEGFSDNDLDVNHGERRLSLNDAEAEEENQLSPTERREQLQVRNPATILDPGGEGQHQGSPGEASRDQPERDRDGEVISVWERARVDDIHTGEIENAAAGASRALRERDLHRFWFLCMMCNLRSVNESVCPCGHAFCFQCSTDQFRRIDPGRRTQTTLCPLCQTPVALIKPLGFDFD